MILRDDQFWTGTVAFTGARLASSSAGMAEIPEGKCLQGLPAGLGWLGLEAGGFGGQRGWDFTAAVSTGKGGAAAKMIQC